MERREQQNLNLNQSTLSVRCGKLKGQAKKEFINKHFVDRWSRIGHAAKKINAVYENLQTHVNVETLKEAFNAIDGMKALGVDGVSKSKYGMNLEENLKDLAVKVQRGTYRVKPRKEVLIPKDKGGTRPIAITCFEDKLVDWVVSKILTQIFEPMFIRNSFGFRPRKSTDDAIKASYYSLKSNKRPYIVEIDFKNFFNTIPHHKLFKILGKRIKDNRFKGLIGRFLLADTINAKGETVKNLIGTPQGSIMSPILANIYLNEVVDQWFVNNHGCYNKIIVRYADDIIFFFKKEDEASNFLNDFRSRIEKHGLQINEDKTQITNFNKKSNKSFDFLGFTFYWGTKWKRKSLKIKTSKKKLIKAFQGFDKWIKDVRNKIKLIEIWKLAKSKLLGHYNYYGYWMNSKKLWYFYKETIKSLFKWLNRRSQKRSYNWKNFKERLNNFPLPKPPEIKDLKKLGWSPYE